MAGAAKEELVRQTGINSRTVASYLYHLDKNRWQAIRDRVRHDAKQLLRAMQGKTTYAPTKIKLTSRDVLILDEAGMLDTRTLERLINHVRKANATLILAGDYAQLPPIAAGGPLKHLVGKVGQAWLRTNMRQRDEADRQAVQDIRDGEASKALKSYAARGRVTVGADKEETMTKLVKSWSANGGARRPGDHLIFTQTRVETDAMNELCQAERKRKGQLGLAASIRVGQQGLYRGDRIMFHEAYRAAGIENGYRGTLLRVDPILRRITVRLDQEPSKEARARGLTQTVTVPLRAFKSGGISLGYSATTHKMQGQTIENSYMLVGGSMTNQEMSYVQATRGRATTRLFVDEAHAGAELVHLAKAMERPVGKNLAHDVGSHRDLRVER